MSSETDTADAPPLRLLDRVLMRTFDTIACLYDSAKLVPGGRRVLDTLIGSAQFRKIFDEADVHGNGALGAEEVYTVVLRFYLFVAQYTTVVARQIPSRDDVLEIVSHGDVNRDGVVGFEEFSDLILMLCEGVATQLLAQLLFTFFISPLLALGFMFILKHLCVVFPSLLAQFWFIPFFLRNEKIGLLCFVPMFNMLVLPYYLEYVFHIQSLRNPHKVRFVPDMTQFQPVSAAIASVLEQLAEVPEQQEEEEGTREEQEEVLHDQNAEEQELEEQDEVEVEVEGRHDSTGGSQDELQPSTGNDRDDVEEVLHDQNAEEQELEEQDEVEVEGRHDSTGGSQDELQPSTGNDSDDVDVAEKDESSKKND